MGSWPKLLAGLMILVLAALFISGCPPSSQSPTDQPPIDGSLPTEQPPDDQPPTDEPPVNQSPVVDRLFSDYRSVKRATATTIECSASDPDGDELSYAWSATGGSIDGEGAVISWLAPEESGTYTITVTVADGRGGQATEAIDIKAACCSIKADRPVTNRCRLVPPFGAVDMN